MKTGLRAVTETLGFAALGILAFSAACWGGPPLPPSSIPATPVGNAEVSAITVAAVAAYGFWKSRR